MAIISVFSLCDFHHENIIVHNLQPYLIDLENCFAKPIKGFDHVLGDGLNKFNVIDQEAPRNRTEGQLDLDLPGDWDKKATQNRICLKNKDGSFQLASPTEYPEQIFDGFYNVLLALMNLEEDITNWLDKTKMCVARSVILPTMEYYTRTKRIYSFPDADHNGEQYFFRPPFEKFSDDAKKAYKHLLKSEPYVVDNFQFYEIWPTDGTRRPGSIGRENVTTAAPIYALQNAENDFRDYLNCDIPAYYHRLNSKDLLNSRGQKVNQFEGVEAAPTNYFPQSTWEIIDDQVQGLHESDKYFERINECTKQIRQWVKPVIRPHRL